MRISLQAGMRKKKRKERLLEGFLRNAGDKFYEGDCLLYTFCADIYRAVCVCVFGPVIPGLRFFSE